MSHNLDTPNFNSQSETQLREEPASFSGTNPSREGGPASQDPNANALDSHAEEASRQQANQFARKAEPTDPNESPDLTRYPGDHFEDGT